MKRIFFNGDAEIINRIRSDDRTVLGELYTANAKMINRYILSNGGNHDDAEDMLQEAIIVLWQKACSDDFRMQAKISTYIYSVVKNKWFAELRKRKKITGDLEENTRDDGPDALKQIIDEEQVREVETAMTRISEICRKIMIFFYYEKRSMPEIADLLGLANADVAKAKKYQCKKALEDAMNVAGT